MANLRNKRNANMSAQDKKGATGTICEYSSVLDYVERALLLARACHRRQSGQECPLHIAPISLVLLYLFRAIVTPADWAISSYPCTRVHFEDASLNLTRSTRCELGY